MRNWDRPVAATGVGVTLLGVCSIVAAFMAASPEAAVMLSAAGGGFSGLGLALLALSAWGR